ncbi:PVC-type heme-binding CxxCH protein [Schlesneria sp. DSM 10557]|uniref:PVC-type heme-binding CxxCH protein n=1 Tax=Schlesneria sp. DSM 10557 TaxID=3044399 RepID=UPI0035A11A62
MEISRPLATLAGIVAAVFLASSGLLAEEKSLAELMPRIAPKTPEEAVKSFKLERGFSLELVAAEPAVTDPIDAAFDEQGRMFVVEMNDYPFLPEQRVKKYIEQRARTEGRIRLLTDTDGDGRMDKSVVFADGLRWPQSVCCAKGGIYVIAPPSLYFMKDTDGDNVADFKEIICTGFNSSNVQALSNGLEWGRDNAIYFSSGISGGELTVPARGGKPEYKFTPGRRDLRLDPATNELTMVGGGMQYGHTIDDWGDRFICSNSNHIVHVTWPLNYLERNPLLVIPEMNRSIAKEGAAALVFRTSSAEPWRLVRTARRAADPVMRKNLPPSELVPIGYFTSATGITVYRGGAYPEEFHGDVFIGDVGGNLIHRKKINPAGISHLAERADKDIEFMTSTDNWFRPANFVNAPDGTLYVLDMYRETIEHPISIPDDIKEFVDLESGYDKGRIWRLVPPGFRRTSPPDLSRASTAELVEALTSPHGWVRDTAQRLLVERQDSSSNARLHEMVAAGQNPGQRTYSAQTRLHALWSLSGLHDVQVGDVKNALKDSDPHLREHGLRIAPQLVQQSPDLAPDVIALANDDSPRVRWQLAFTLGDLPPELAVSGLKSIAAYAANDADLRTAWLSSIYSQMGTVAVELLSGPTEPVVPVLVQLGRLIGSAPDQADSVRLLQSIVPDRIPDSTRIPVLLALGEGLRRRGTTITKTLADSPSTNESADAIRAALDHVFERAAATVLDRNAAEADRISAATLLALGDSGLAERTLPELFTPQTSPTLQQAAVKSLVMQGTEAGFNGVLEPWKSFGPATRREVVDNLVQSAKGGEVLVKAVESGMIKPSEIERDKRQLLLNHPQPAVRDAARQLLAEPSSNRKQVVLTYQPALELKGDPERGRMVYTKTCIQCHRDGTSGHQVGPDFASVKNKSPDDLLIAILDPNREAQPNFQTYTAITQQGKIYTGIISAETEASITLKRAEAKEDVVLRDTLDELVSSGLSLMPEGLEKDLDPQQIADLIAWIKGER